MALSNSFRTAAETMSPLQLNKVSANQLLDKQTDTEEAMSSFDVAKSENIDEQEIVITSANNEQLPLKCLPIKETINSDEFKTLPSSKVELHHKEQSPSVVKTESLKDNEYEDCDTVSKRRKGNTANERNCTKTRDESLDSLNEFLQIISQEDYYSCHLCDFTTRRKGYLKNHINGQHIQGTVYKCNQCDFSSHYSWVTKRHEKLHSIAPLSCTICDANFGNTNELKFHIASHSETQNKSYSCASCEYSCSTTASLRKHEWETHRKDDLYSCEQCGYKTSSNLMFKRHLLKHQLEKEKPLRCACCDFKSASLSNIRQHMKYKHKPK